MGPDWASENDSPLAGWVIAGLVNMTVHLPEGTFPSPVVYGTHFSTSHCASFSQF